MQTLVQTTAPRCLCVNKPSPSEAHGSLFSHSASSLGSRKLKVSRILGKQAALRPFYAKTLMFNLSSFSRAQNTNSSELPQEREGKKSLVGRKREVELSDLGAEPGCLSARPWSRAASGLMQTGHLGPGAEGEELLR